MALRSLYTLFARPPAASATAAFHVLRTSEHGPCSALVEPFFDYIVGLNGQTLAALAPRADAVTLEDTLATLVEQSEDIPLRLQIWSSKRQELREVEVVPSRAWSIVPHDDLATARNSEVSEVSLDDHSQPSLLGLSLRLCNPDGALEKVWHVLEILEGSPAESAGLVPFGDYILGYSGGVLHKESDFYKLVEEHIDQPLRLFVYNADFDVTREVVIVPNRAWSAAGSGEGLLGCGVGYGVLHRIPIPTDRPTSALNTPTANPEHLSDDTSPPIAASAGASSPNHAQPQIRGQSIPPKRMTASLAASPSTPPRSSSPGLLNSNKAGLGQTQGPGAQGWKSAIPSSSLGVENRLPTGVGLGNPNRGSGYALSAPPRSPSSASQRGSVAEVIAEEDE